MIVKRTSPTLAQLDARLYLKLYNNKNVQSLVRNIIRRSQNSEVVVRINKPEKYMTVLTTKFGDIKYTLKRTVLNNGTREKPQMVTSALWFMNPDDVRNSIIIYYKKPGDNKAGFLINLFRKDMYKIVKEYPSLEAIRRDKEVIGIIGKWLNKDLITPKRGYLEPPKDETVGEKINTTV